MRFTDDSQISQSKSICGLCGSKTKNLTKTHCCDNWICDGSDSNALFSCHSNSCYENHDCYTICAYHSNEKHKGEWQDCKKCKNSFDLPNYVDMGTNEYNFDVLQNPEKVTVTCVNCGFTADSINGFAYQTSKGHFCSKKKCEEAAFKF